MTAESPATTISAGSDISGANYHPTVDAAAAISFNAGGVAAAASCGGGSAATVTGCVGSNENAHWNIECWPQDFFCVLLFFRMSTRCLMCDIVNVCLDRYSAFRVGDIVVACSTLPVSLNWSLMTIYCVRSYLCSRTLSQNSSGKYSNTRHIVGERVSYFSKNAILHTHTHTPHVCASYESNAEHSQQPLFLPTNCQTPGASNGQLELHRTLSAAH